MLTSRVIRPTIFRPYTNVQARATSVQWVASFRIVSLLSTKFESRGLFGTPRRSIVDVPRCRGV